VGIVVKKYAPDLSRFMRLCETNYLQLIKLLPVNFTRRQSYAFSAGQNIDYQIDVLEQSPYTSLLRVRQLCENQPDFMTPIIRVRLYHDAKLAEVCASQHIFHFQPKYDYPNDKMHHKDEKLQVNLFLADWLKFCIEHGYCRQQIFKANDSK